MIGLVRLATRRPALTIVVCLLFAALGAGYTARALSFQTSSVELLPPDRVYVQRFKDYLADFGELNDIVIVVAAPEIEHAKTFAGRLADMLQAPPSKVARLTYRIDPERLGGRALLFTSTAQLQELRDKVNAHQAFLTAYAAHPTLAQLVEGVNEEIARRFAGRFVDLGLEEPARLDISFIDTLLRGIAERLEATTRRPSAWQDLFTESADRSGYFLSRDKSLLFMLVEPRREAGNFTDNQHVIEGIRASIRALRAELPGVEAGVTGTPALGNDEMLTAFRDSGVATTLAAILTLVSVLLVFRRVTKPLAMFLVLAVSLAWSLGLVTLTVGHLTVFSVMFISLFVGIGIDYGIYFLFRYEEERSAGRTVRAALDVTAARAGRGILFAALSAAGTFGVLTLTEFRGIVEFGFIAGLAILMALLAMITLFPAVLVVLDRHAEVRPTAGAIRPGVRMLERLTAYRRPIVAAAGALTVFSIWAVSTVGFDYNRLNLQAKGTESATWERRILASGRSAFPALASAATLDELRGKRDAFGRLSAVSDVVSVLDVIPKDQPAKIPIIHDFAAVVGPVRVADADDEDPEQLRAALTRLRRRLDVAIREADSDSAVATLTAADERAQRLVGRLQNAGDEIARRLRVVQAEFRDDFAAQLRRVQANLAPRPVTVADLPPEITRKFIGASGAFLMQIYPSVNTWDREGMEAFVADLRSVDRAVTGSPVISYEASRMMERAYVEGTLYAGVLVVALAFLSLRRWRETWLAVLPMVLATLWTVGVMRVVGLSFNLANVWALPLVIGAAAEYGLNVALRHQEAATLGGPALARSTVLAVLLNAITNIAGFGSLMVARHQGMFSLGVLLTVGAVAGLAASLVVLPVLLRQLSGVAAAAATDVGARRVAALALMLLVTCAGVAHAGEPTDQVRTAITEIYALLTSPDRPPDRRERDAAAARVMERLFDWTAMARQSLGAHWQERTATEREEFTQLFADVFRHAYLARVSLVDATKFRYLGDRTSGDRATVDTEVFTKRGSAIAVAYVVARDGRPTWRVQDVRVEGISLLDNYRTQFASIMNRYSYETLVTRLRDRARASP